MKIFRVRTDRPAIYGSVFFLSWWIGAIALLTGLGGSLTTGLAVLLFGIACALWWLAYRMSRFVSQAGFFVIALWGLGPVGALFDIRFYVSNPLLWISIAVLLALTVVASIMRRGNDADRVVAGSGAAR